MVPSSASRPFGVTTGCHSRGGAKQLYGVGPRPLSWRRTVAEVGDAPETSPFRRTGYSRQWLDPRGVTTGTEHARANRDPRRALCPEPVASAQLDFGSAGGPHRRALESDRAL